MTAPAQKNWRRRLSSLTAAAFALALITAGTVLPGTLASASSGHAWTGKGDGTTWGDARNWAGNSVPQNGDSVTIGPTASQSRPAVTGTPGGIRLQDLDLTDASLSGGAVTVVGDFTWDVSEGHETLAAPLTVEGTASFSGAGEEDSQDPMTLEGDTDFAGPGLLSVQDRGTAITNSGTLRLEPGAVVRATVCCETTDELLNTGTVSLAGSRSGTASVAFMRFDDQGSVLVGPGSLLDVSGGPGQFGPGAHLSGGGTLQFDQGATMTLSANVTVSAGSTLALTGNAEFFGPGSLKGVGTFSWTGGTIDGSVDVGTAVKTTIGGSTGKSLISPGHTRSLLAFHGPTTVQGSGPLEAFSADISTSGTFTVKPGATIKGSTCCVSPDTFTSTGTLNVPASASGTANLALMRFQDQGAVSVGAGSTLLITAAPGTFNSGLSISGGGTVKFDQNAEMTLANNLSISTGTTVTLTGESTFAGPGSFSGSGDFLWTGGTIEGDLDVAGAIHTTISGAASKSLTSPGKTPTALTMHGTTTLEGTGEVELSGATTLNNLGTLTMQPGTTIGASVCCATPDHFTNSGTLRVAAGPASATVTNLVFTNTGRVDITGGTLVIGTLNYRQAAGETQLAGGSLSAVQPVDIAGGTLSGFGTVTGSVVNEGTVSPSTTGGLLRITGAYKQTNKGELLSVITGTKPGVQFGQLDVGGGATLAGSVHAETGSGFTPRHRQSFTVLVCHGRSGKFATTTGQPSFSVMYSATAAKVVFP